ncbi:MAG: hypothetical protein ACRC0V_01300, partial [Fusobacteriaceae bacterium]
ITSFIEFCGDADHFIAHNFSFDRDFLCFESATFFCTFLESKKMNIGKYNKLSDLASYYGINSIEENLHSSMYDVEILFDIVKNIYREKNQNFMKFLEEKPMNKKEQKIIQTRFSCYLNKKRDLLEKLSANNTREIFE